MPFLSMLQSSPQCLSVLMQSPLQHACLLALETATHSRRQLQQYWHVAQMDEEAAQKALGELEEGWREFGDEGRTGTPSKAAANKAPSHKQVRRSRRREFDSSCRCSHRSRLLCCEVGLGYNKCPPVSKGVAAAGNSMMLLGFGRCQCSMPTQLELTASMCPTGAQCARAFTDVYRFRSSQAQAPWQAATIADESEESLCSS